MKILLILTVLMVGDNAPRSHAEVMPTLEDCVSKAHKALVNFDNEMDYATKKKTIGYGAQCVVMLPEGDPA